MIFPIKVHGKVVNLEGDEMTRVIWGYIKELLILPFLDIDLETYDLSLENRDRTNDEITIQAAEAILKNGIGIKCATITPDEARLKEFGLKKMWKSPNGTIRNILNGTIFREPIVIQNVPRYLPKWNKPIIIGRHAYADQYNAVDIEISEPGKLKLVFEGQSKSEFTIKEFDSSQRFGVGLGMFNSKDSITAFANSCFKYALEKKLPLYFTSKNTILKKYDGLFKKVFSEAYENDFKSEFLKNNIWYEHKLIDDMVAYSVKSEGGFVWACKNYDGDVQSDFVAQGYGSLGLMTSVLYSPGGQILTEAAHGTVTRHFRDYQKGKDTSTNSIASIFAWTRGLYYKSKSDNNENLLKFSLTLEESVRQCVEAGYFTKDIAICVYKVDNPSPSQYLNTKEFILKIKERLLLNIHVQLKKPKF